MVTEPLTAEWMYGRNTQFMLGWWFGLNLGYKIKERITRSLDPQEIVGEGFLNKKATRLQLKKEMEEEGLLGKLDLEESSLAAVSNAVRGVNARLLLPLEIPICTIPAHAAEQMQGRFREKIRFYYRLLPVGSLGQDTWQYLQKRGTPSAYQLARDLRKDYNQFLWWQEQIKTAAIEKIELCEPVMEALVAAPLEQWAIPEELEGGSSTIVEEEIEGWQRTWTWNHITVDEFVSYCKFRWDCSRAEVAKRFGLSSATLSNIIAQRQAAGSKVIRILNEWARKLEWQPKGFEIKEKEDN